MNLLKRIISLIFPPKCVLCKKVLEKDETDLCKGCRVGAPACPVSHGKLSFLDSWVAIWHYEDAVRASVLRFKFYGKRGYAHAYGRLLAMKLQQEHPEGFDLITWVPTGFFRKLRRGYDQAKLLADAVSAELNTQAIPLLKKVRHNRVQSRIIGDARRRANVLGAYKVIDPVQIRDKRILLVDDVITTGATAGECARVMLTAGCKEVHCGAVARARHNKR